MAAGSGLHTEAMDSHPHRWQPGNTYFFSAHLRDPHSRLLVDHAAVLRLAFRIAQQSRPFRMNAIVVLPSQLHGIWTLPAGDEEGDRRWRQVQAVFDRQLPGQPPRAMLRRDRCARPLWHDHFHHQRIADHTELLRQVAQVHHAPVRHGHVREAAHWPYSSIHRRAGDEEPR